MIQKLKTAKRLLKENKSAIPYAIFRNMTRFGLTRIISDKLYLKILYKLATGNKLNLDNPQTFNEKLQWLKLYDRKPEYTVMVDKYRVRKYIANAIGKEYLIPLLGVWENANNIDFDRMPNQFVLKCNHDSGSVVICRDKSKLDKDFTVRKLNHALKNSWYWIGREWPYKNVKPCIIAEKYIKDLGNADLPDYKFMCFNGKVRCIFTCTDRYIDELKVTFFDRNWNVLPFERHYPKSQKPIQKPENYNKMVMFAEKLAKDIPFVRVDFYEVSGKLYFGELTFFPGSGIEEFIPESADYELGNWIELPKNSRNDLLDRKSI